MTQLEVNRRGGKQRPDVGARGLSQFEEKMGLVDAGYYNIPRHHTQAELSKYQAKHHTYWHKAHDGTVGSSRIDRWYQKKGR